MRIFFFICSLLAVPPSLFSQNNYADSLTSYQQNYAQQHEVVTGDDKSFFRFFTPTEAYNVTATIEKATATKWVTMETSGPLKKTFRIYGYASFSIRDTLVRLTLYQPQTLLETGDGTSAYLFVPFTDKSSGEETYASGRYLNLEITSIRNNQLQMDFNKAYNPYCAYVSGKYNCPIPPKENHLPVAIYAGERNFAKK